MPTVSLITLPLIKHLGIMYQGKYDHAAEKDNSKLSAFKLWNFGFKAAPKAGVVSIPSQRYPFAF